MLQIGQRPLLSERTTSSTRWPLCGGCLEKPAASGEEQHHEEIARYPVYQDSACSRKRPKRLSLAGYGVNPVGRPGAPTTTTTSQRKKIPLRNTFLSSVEDYELFKKGEEVLEIRAANIRIPDKTFYEDHKSKRNYEFFPSN